MTARQMFEKLGYEYNERTEKLYGIIEYSKQFEYAEMTIDFDNKSKEVELYTDKSDVAIDITLEELQAINKQVEELEWYND